MPAALSERHVFANKIAKLIRDRGIKKGVTAKLVELDGRKFYQVDYGKGKVNVYGTDFVQFQVQGSKNKDGDIFDNTTAALKYFKMGVLEENVKEAKKIPRKKKVDKD